MVVTGVMVKVAMCKTPVICTGCSGMGRGKKEAMRGGYVLTRGCAICVTSKAPRKAGSDGGGAECPSRRKAELSLRVHPDRFFGMGGNLLGAGGGIGGLLGGVGQSAPARMVAGDAA